MGNPVTKKIEPGDVIEISEGGYHLSRHIVLYTYIEEGSEELGIPDEEIIATYAIYCVDTLAKHLNINEIWKIPLENYLKRDSSLMRKL